MERISFNSMRFFARDEHSIGHQGDIDRCDETAG